MKKVLLTVILLLSVTLAACSPAFAGEVVKSEKDRILNPSVSESDMALLLEGNNDFALALYSMFKNEKDGNLFYSPYSISLMMAMPFAGAEGETANQISNAMKYYLSRDKLHEAFNYLGLQISDLNSDSENFKLNIVNDIWGEKSYTFLDTYLDIIAQYYGAGLRALDFINKPDEACSIINNYISEQTDGRINNLIPEGMINPFTSLVLTNAIYFNAEWKHKFDKNNTHDGVFYRLDGSHVTVPMMNQTSDFKYAEGEFGQVIELPYLNERVVMNIILPDDFVTFENSMDTEQINQILDSLYSCEVQLSMPKFEFTSDFDLKSPLKKLGMVAAFDPNSADFSGITGEKELCIEGVVHKAFIKVDEEKTEAAAAGAAMMAQPTSTYSLPTPMIIDRPFIFFIHDLQTGTILFMGRVLNPAS